MFGIEPLLLITSFLFDKFTEGAVPSTSWGKSIEQISKLKQRNLLYFRKFFAKY